MIILTTSAASQSFTVIPRFEPTANVDVTFTSEQQNKLTHTFNFAATYLNGYLTITNTFAPVLIDGQNYIVEIKDGAELCFRGKSFITDQTTFAKFSINESIFTEQPSSNEFIII
jgi:hypothetical protein